MELNETIRAKMRFPRSVAEMERRWDLARRVMKEHDIDLLLASNDNKYLGGYVRWFLDVPAVQGYPMTVMFGADGEMTTITHGARDFPLLPEWAMRGPTNRLSAPYIRTLDYTDRYDSEMIVAHIKEKKARRLGIVGNAQLNHVIIDDIRENTNVELVNMTSYIDLIKGSKSGEELEMIEKSAKMHDEVMEYATQIVRPGMREYELHASLIKKLLEMGSEEQLVMIGSAPAGTCAAIQYLHYQNRVIEKGDEITLMIECSGPGGYYCEIGRSFSLNSRPSESLQQLFDQSKEVQQRTAALLKPGKVASEVTKEVNLFLKEMNLPKEHRIFTHGQGYDLIESPGFDLADGSVIQPNMSIAVHPTYVTPGGFGFCCDEYLVGETETRRLHRFPQEIICI